jgi:predicted ATPase/class 3 adenylate cyclase
VSFVAPSSPGTELPTGTVTFLFSDIVQSTRLWERHPASMSQALARHDAIIERTVADHRGVVVRPRGEGDSRFGVFREALSATITAAEIQIALQAEVWPVPEGVRVRIALHTGEAELRSGDYYGSTVNRCARLRALAHGGQVLLSGITASLVRDRLPPPMALKSLGTHDLKDLAEAETIFQLLHAALADEFPPLASAGAWRSRLPDESTSLVDRERDLEAIQAMLRRPEVRLLTLTGAGGSGKTRLALRISRTQVDDYADGVFFVELSQVREPSAVASAIGKSVGIRESAGRTVPETLRDHLHGKTVLLTLDNFEHVLPAANIVQDLLQACGGLKVLVTSRAALRVYGEHEYPVQPLELPDQRFLPPLLNLEDYPSIRLFVERASAAQPRFQVGSDNAAAIVEICHRVDGLPLAIELAAARMRVMPPQALVSHLEHRLPLLSGGEPGRPARQQSLRNAIAWSYELLDAGEQALFRHLAVFSGGFTIEAANAVAHGDASGPDVGLIDGLGDLIGKSLLQRTEANQPRFSMLETVREYAWEQLEASGEVEMASRRHADHFATLAEGADAHLRDAGQLESLELLEREHANMLGALAWGAAAGDVDRVLRLAAALRWYWFLRAPTQGQAWLERAVASSDAPPWRTSKARIRAMLGVVELAWAARGHDVNQVIDECLKLCTAAGDSSGIAWVQHVRGERASVFGDRQSAQEQLEESVRTLRRYGSDWEVARALLDLATHTRRIGEHQRARELRSQSLAVFQSTGDRWGTAHALAELVLDAIADGQPDTAVQLVQQTIGLSQQIGDVRGISRGLILRGWLAFRRGEMPASKRSLDQAADLALDTGNQFTVARVLNMYGEWARVSLEYHWAVQLYEHSLQLFNLTTASDAVASVVQNLGHAVLHVGDTARAASLFRQGLMTLKQPYLPHALVGVAGLAQAFGFPEDAAMLLGAAANDLALRHDTFEYADQPEYDRHTEASRAELGDHPFNDAWTRGAQMPLPSAVGIALTDVLPRVAARESSRHASSQGAS